MPNSAFCADHKRKCPRVSPMTGYEPKYNPDLWNKKREHKDTHNCFAYAMNILDPEQIANCLKDKECNLPFHQPGSKAGYPRFKSEKPKTCPNMIARLLGDNPSLSLTTFERKCPAKTSKIALIVDEDEDYHFLRQDSNGWWSQKGGAKPVTNKDASDRPIWDPALCDNDWTNEQGKLDYDVFCAYMCVPRVEKLWIKIGGGRRQTKKRKSLGRREKKSKWSRTFRTKRS